MNSTQPFDVFHRLVLQALGESSAHDESLDLQVFRAEDTPGAVVVKFFPEELAESLHAVYVPAGLDDDGSVMERLHEAVATHEGLVPEEDPRRQRAVLTEVRELLERYLEATDGPAAAGAADADDGDDRRDASATDAGAAADEVDDDMEDDADDDSDDDDGTPPARIEFGPLEALQALGAAKDGRAAGGLAVADGAAATVETPEEAFPDDRPSFRALALDVLSGVPLPHGSAHDLPDSYEVWAFRQDPIATVVLRLFDGGRAAVLGALAPGGDEFDAGRFFAAAYQLLGAKLPGAVDGALEGRLSDLEPLDTAAAMERLGRALGYEHTRDVRELTTDLLGEADEATEDAYEQIRRLDPRAESNPADLFGAIARDVVELGGDVLWTKRKEREAVPRIEVLEHRAYRGALLLIDFGQPDQPVEAAAYLPGERDANPEFEADVRRLLDARAVFTTPRPLDDDGPFRRVPNPQAVFAVESALDALEAGEGHALAFRAPDA
jgi:hypothetical protein